MDDKILQFSLEGFKLYFWNETIRPFNLKASYFAFFFWLGLVPVTLLILIIFLQKRLLVQLMINQDVAVSYVLCVLFIPLTI